MSDVITTILLSEILLPTISFVIALLIGWVVKLVKDWTGVEVEAKHRDAFQTSLENAARLLTMRHGPMTPGNALPVELAREGLNYVKRGAPDAVRHFKLNDDSIVERLLPHLLTAAAGLVFK